MQRRAPDYSRYIILALLCAVVFCGAFSFSWDVLAQAVAPTFQPDPETHYTGDLFCPYNYDGVAGRVAHCIEAIVIQAAITFLDRFMPYYEAIVISAMVLAVTLYGALFALGAVSQPTSQTFILLFKIGAVAFFTLHFGGMVEEVFAIMKGLLAIVTNYVTVSTLSACSDNGHLAGFFDLPRENLTVWDKVDCLFITLLGITVVQTAVFGIIAVLAKFIVTGGIGLMIFAAAVMFMLMLLFAVARALFMYLSAVIAIAFLICISPLMIPLVLFSSTQDIFKKWLKNLANYMLIPVFLFAFLAMMVAAYDALIFKGPSSLYYAIASEASQEEGFNFRDWLEYGVSGEIARDADGKAQLTEDGEPVLKSGQVVGRDVPGLDAVALINYNEICTNGDDDEKKLLGDICDRDLDTMLGCAINPRIPMDGEVPEREEGDDCEDVEGRPYYGFLRNEELFHFAIAPNIKTDSSIREAENKPCNLLCKAGRGLKKVAGAAFNLAKQVVGAVVRFGGWLVQLVGKAYKAVGTFIKDYCPFPKGIPGAVCDATGGALMVAGNVVHAVGTFVNFSGRVAMNGLAAELGELFAGFFDAETIDLQKVASYRCKVERKLTDPRDLAYVNDCPGPEDIVMDIFYVIITAAVVAYLMVRWLNYIPSLGSTLVGGTRIETAMPGEIKLQRGLGKIEHGFERMAAKRKGVG